MRAEGRVLDHVLMQIKMSSPTWHQMARNFVTSPSSRSDTVHPGHNAFGFIRRCFCLPHHHILFCL